MIYYKLAVYGRVEQKPNGKYFVNINVSRPAKQTDPHAISFDLILRNIKNSEGEVKEELHRRHIQASKLEHVCII